MSYRLITKGFLAINGASTPVDIRAYASPKAAPIGDIEVNLKKAPYKLTGGQGRGAVVRSYMYFPFNSESAYVELTNEQFATIKAGGATVSIATTTVPPMVSVAYEPEAPDTVEALIDAVSEAVEQPTPAKATRRAKKVNA